MATPRTPEGSGVPCAWPLNSSSGLDARLYVRAEKLAEETKMDYDVGLRACLTSVVLYTRCVPSDN